MSESNKRTLRKYEEISRTYHSISVAFETLCALGVDAAALFKALGAHIKSVTHKHWTFDYLRQRDSVAITPGNAACILGTLPSNSNIDAIHY